MPHTEVNVFLHIAATYCSCLRDESGFKADGKGTEMNYFFHERRHRPL